MFAVMLILSMLAGTESDPTRATALEAMVHAEENFARTAREFGTRTAFLSVLDSEGVIFRPGPVPGRPVFLQAPEGTASLLAWYPSFADMSLSGDLGFTTGPSEYHADRQQTQAPTCGHFVTVWKLTDGGAWKVQADIGTSHACPGLPLDQVKTEKAPEPSDSGGDIDSLAAAETRFWEIQVEKGLKAALREYAADSLRYYPPDAPPVVGAAAAVKAAAGKGWDIQTLGTSMSRAGDLGCTFGASGFEEKKTSHKGGFLTIWRFHPSQGWRLVLFIADHKPV